MYAQFGDVVDDLVGGQEEEIAVLNVRDGPHAHHRCATGDAKEAQFGNGRIDHAIGKLLLQAERYRERATPPAGHADVFANAEDALVALHFFGDGLTQGFGDP